MFKEVLYAQIICFVFVYSDLRTYMNMVYECMVIVDRGDSIESTDIRDETVFISTRESYQRETER